MNNDEKNAPSSVVANNETNAKISPDEGSIATIPPRLFTISASPYCCNLLSSVKVTSFPGKGRVSNIPFL